eukprot:TRINITY_DN75339_c0_g1_i1.p1 TRINITY_DN75339_c0_g1~~TRINITY_DN75339_c0_g1_i1.p1  ORF type:complete len:278 (-),score=41.28 TRINITY_DN75339_c0_g1_i1:314-1120(-)
MAGQVEVTIQGLGGDELRYEMDASGTVAILRSAIADAWSLNPRSFQFFAGSFALRDCAEFGSCSGGEAKLILQLVKFDPLLGLGKFDASAHEGIEIESLAGDGDGHYSTLRKTSDSRDSNNVFLSHPIREPCFVEFEVLQSLDEISFGVTGDRQQVEDCSGFRNLWLDCTWIFSKRKSMPTLLFAGHKSNPAGHPSISQNDRVALFVDPIQQEVKFYRNGTFIASNLPAHPLPPQTDDPLWIYVMVDQTGDEVSIVRFGPGMVFDYSD